MTNWFFKLEDISDKQIKLILKNIGYDENGNDGKTKSIPNQEGKHSIFYAVVSCYLVLVVDSSDVESIQKNLLVSKDN